MSATEQPQQAAAPALTPTCMESVNRVVRLPVVESTIQTAQNIYEKVKDYNSVTNWTLQTAEDTAYKAVDIAKPYTNPVMHKLEGPIKKVDDVLCSGLDYVEAKVPAVKLPAKEIYESTKQYVAPAVETARHTLEPAITKTINIVEPLVEPIVHKVDQFLHKNQEAPESEQAGEDPNTSSSSNN